MLNKDKNDELSSDSYRSNGCSIVAQMTVTKEICF